MNKNKLPEGFKGEQKRRTEFDSEGAQLDYDAKNLIAIAKAQSEKLGKVTDPIDYARRADDDIEALRATIAKKQSAINPEATEIDVRLASFKADFDQDYAIRAGCSWAEIQRRLLANGNHYLQLAEAMDGGGILFGVDEECNPLIANRGDEPIMKGRSYEDTRNRVLYKHNTNDEIIIGEGGQPVQTGYEMFPYAGNCNKSPEILMYEAHTGKPFVRSFPDKNKRRSAWVESGKNPSQPRFVNFNPCRGYTCMGMLDDPNVRIHLVPQVRGTRILLRVRFR